MMFNVTFNNISAISWREVLLVEETVRFPRKNVLTPNCFRGLCFIYVICIYLYIYWCLTRFPYQMMFESFNNNTMGFTSGAEIAYTSGARKFRKPFPDLILQPLGKSSFLNFSGPIVIVITLGNKTQTLLP
jgi:hypothetical protein